MISSAAIDRLPADEISAIQDRLLSETVAYAYEHSPFYRKRLLQLGLSPSDIRTTRDLSLLPCTTREEMEADNWSFMAVPRGETAEIVSTSGTTGSPVFIAMTSRDLDRLARNEERSFGYAGASGGDLFHIAVTSDNLFIAGIAYYSGLMKLGASVMRVGPQNPLRQIDLIGRLKPDGIVAVPSLLALMLRRMRETGVEAADLGIRKIVLIGDSIRNSDFTSNALGKIIEDAFGRICHSTYGITEAQLSFCECRSFEGLHSHPDFVLAEILDEEGRSLPDGEVGELVLTPFGIEGMPLIRYRTGDMTFRIPGECSCGRRSARIGPIAGRKHQRLKVKGVTVYPKTIENAVFSVRDIVNYQIEACTGDDRTDQLILRIGAARNGKALIEELREALSAKARVVPQIEVSTPEEIEKRLHEGGSRKAITFKDRRVGFHE